MIVSVYLKKEISSKKLLKKISNLVFVDIPAFF